MPPPLARWVRGAVLVVAAAGAAAAVSVPPPLRLVPQQIQTAYLGLDGAPAASVRPLSPDERSAVVRWLDGARVVVPPAGACRPIATSDLVLRTTAGRRIGVGDVQSCGRDTYAALSVGGGPERSVAQPALINWLLGFVGPPPRVPPGTIEEMLRLDGAFGDVPGLQRDAANAAALDRIAALLRAAPAVAGVARGLGGSSAGQLAQQQQDAVMGAAWVLDFSSGRVLPVDATVERCYPSGPPPSPSDVSVTCIEDADYAIVASGVVYAPGLVAALSALVPVWPALTVDPGTVAPGGSLRVSVVGLYPSNGTTTLQVRPIAGACGGVTTLGTARVSGGGLEWSGALPSGLPPGRYILYGTVGSVGAEIQVAAAATALGTAGR